LRLAAFLILVVFALDMFVLLLHLISSGCIFDIGGFRKSLHRVHVSYA
jgi:hypothetical protein